MAAGSRCNLRAGRRVVVDFVVGGRWWWCCDGLDFEDYFPTSVPLGSASGALARPRCEKSLLFQSMQPFRHVPAAPGTRARSYCAHSRRAVIVIIAVLRFDGAYIKSPARRRAFFRRWMDVQVVRAFRVLTGTFAGLASTDLLPVLLGALRLSHGEE